MRPCACPSAGLYVCNLTVTYRFCRALSIDVSPDVTKALTVDEEADIPFVTQVCAAAGFPWARLGDTLAVSNARVLCCSCSSL